VIDLAIRGGSLVIVPSIVLAETLTGGPQDAPVNQVLSKVTVVSITEDLARDAALLKRKSGMTGVEHTIDAIVVAVSASQGGGVVLTSDPGDIKQLADEVYESRIRAIKV
jgi:predicted nucleic acid-binding protein